MTKLKAQEVQEVQEYTPEQVVQLKQAAAHISGAAADKLTIEQAENIVLTEIGETVPNTPKAKTRKQIIKYLDQIFSKLQQTKKQPEDLAKLEIEDILLHLAAIKYRIVAVKAGHDNGKGIEEELAQLSKRTTELKEQQSIENVVLDEFVSALSNTEKWACLTDDKSPRKELDLSDIDAAEKEIAEEARISQEAVKKLQTIPERLKDITQSDTGESLKATAELAQSVMGEKLKTTSKLAQSFGKVFEALRKKAEQAEKVLTEFVKSEKFEQLSLLFDDITYWLDPKSPGNNLDIFWLSDFIENIDTLKPYIEAEIERLKTERNIKSISFEEFISDVDPETGLSCESLIERCIKKAQKAINAKNEEISSQLPKVVIKRAELVEYPLDKVNSTIWRLLERDTGGKLIIKSEKSGSKKQVNIIYSIDFEDLGKGVTITKRLTAFDKRTYIAVAALYNAGNNVITLSQIYCAMGYTGTPGKNDLTKINDAISKMAGAKVYVNNADEPANGYKYTKFIYDGILLPIERVQAVVNGKLADAAIHIFREPPIITFAKQREQITTIDVKLLQSPMSKTDSNLQIDDYLIERICKAQRSKKKHSTKILYTTLYDHAGIKTKKQKQRAPEKIERYLVHYKTCGKINRYTVSKDGVTVHW